MRTHSPIGAGLYALPLFKFLSPLYHQRGGEGVTYAATFYLGVIEIIIIAVIIGVGISWDDVKGDFKKCP